MSPPQRVLIVGVSTRAAAESAARAGFDVTAIDAFGDIDQHPGVNILSLPDGFSPQSVARAADEIEFDGLVYLAGFENHPAQVASFATRSLWGNPPAVLGRVRDPVEVARAFGERGHRVPRVSRTPPMPRVGHPEEDRWLIKRQARGGGLGVRLWHQGIALSPGYYLEELVDGTPGSVVFVAAGGHALTLGVSRQLIGEQAFGASGYQYCGSIFSSRGREDQALIGAAAALADTAAAEFGLVGLNGIDFVASRQVPYPVEVNPRWCASMEVVERAYGCPVFAAHVDACTRGVLPEFDFRAQRTATAFGKAVVFARRDVTLGDTRVWLEGGDEATIRDVPRPGERIRAGRPVCTVFGTGADEEACHRELVRRGEAVYGQLARWERGA